MSETATNWLTVEEAAEALGREHWAFRKLAEYHGARKVRKGKRVYYSRGEIAKLAAATLDRGTQSIEGDLWRRTRLKFGTFGVPRL